MEQEHILNTHIDTLSEWWENAEKGDPIEGDLFIIRVSHKEYVITPAMVDFLECDDSRILARAPKPKPAWHDAVAVIAHTDGLDYRRLFRSTVYGWRDLGATYASGDLRDVTPLVEAKVTDEMVIRARGTLKRATGYDYAYAIVQDALTAALGLETA